VIQHHERTIRPLEMSPAPTTRGPAPRLLRIWIVPVLVMAVAAFLVFLALYALDVILLGGDATSFTGLLQRYLSFDPGMITDALPALGMTIVAALGIVLTVVAIIVQLSSDRYTGVAMMFLRDPVNIAVMSFYVIASLCAVWLSVALHEDFVPRVLLLAVMVLTSIGLATMLPYFAYVFWFLEPGNIIDRLRAYTTRLNRRGLALPPGPQVALLQGKVLTQMEEITDIANNSIDGRDKIVAGRAVDALRDFLIDYIATKPAEERSWYRIGRTLRENPNFVAMDLELLGELDQQHLWVEWKTLRQFLGVYDEALDSMEEINSLIAIDTRYIGETAAGKGEWELVRMVFRFFNSYLRSAINHGSVRTAFNVLHQYRMLLQRIMRFDQSDLAIEGVAFLRYYGHIAFDQGMPFIIETVAYDIAALCEYAHRDGLAAEERILRQFLELDMRGPGRSRRYERGLRGVRKAQAKLAVYYLSAGEQARAQLIADDMRDEPPELLRAIHAELAEVESPHFWEIIDRGRNFDYLPPLQRAQLEVFFRSLGA
jgi:hypothetical protein